jgi:FkbM family methyltransferase
MQQPMMYFSLNGLDKKVAKYLSYPSGYFVELGANNGIEQSNTLHFERCRNWRGVLIEPVPHQYLACKKHRSPENKFFCNACVSFEWTEAFVPILYCNLMSISLGVESDIGNRARHVASGQKYLPEGEEVVLFGAKAKPLNNILLEAGAPKTIDFLSLDVEGAEKEVLKGIDFSEFRFKYMCIECRDIKGISLYLHERGYRYVERLSDMDILYSSCD